MKIKIIVLLLAVTVCFPRCQKTKHEKKQLSTNSEQVIIDPVTNYCYEINGGRMFRNPLVLNKRFSGRIAVRTEIDTITLKLVKVRIIKTFLFNNKDSSIYAKFINTDFDNEPKYTEELIEILPKIKEYLDTVKVTRINQNIDCEVSSSFSILLNIK
jgi:hypothetical protein